jgi:PAS domain S-box-containing protein
VGGTPGPWTFDRIVPLLDTVFARSPLAAAVHDRQLRMIYVNAAMAALGKVQPSVCLGQSLEDTAPMLGFQIAPFLEHVFQTGAMVTDLAVGALGRHWFASCHPLRGPDGTTVAVCSVLQEDTERHQIEQCLRESEERYRSLVELSPDGISIVEGERFAYINPAGIEILGARHAEEIVGRSVWDFAPPDFGSQPRGRLWELTADSGGLPYDARILRVDGAEAVLSLRSVTVDRGRGPTLQAIFRDVTALRRDERTRRRVRRAREVELALLEAIHHELPVGVVVTDSYGKLLVANDAAERIWGERFGPWSLPIEPWSNEFDAGEVASDGPSRLMRALSEELGETDVAREVVCGDGVTRCLRGSVKTITSTDGTMRGALATFWDATALARTQEELRRSQEALETRVAERTASLAEANERLRKEASEREAAERQLRMTERLAAIGTLAGGLAHEINNPLAAVVATAELARALNEDGGRRGEMDAALARIVEEAHRGGTIVKSLLRLGRMGPGERWLVDVNGLVRRLAESQRVRSVLDDCRLRTRLARRSVCVVIDPSELEQVVLNLVQNAVQAGATEVAVHTAARNGSARIVVRDDGCGIDPRDIDRIFDPFFTTRGNDGGTGLGLSIVHGIVTRYDGRIGVQSRIGRGTSFTVDLPAGVRNGEQA